MFWGPDLKRVSNPPHPCIKLFCLLATIQDRTTGRGTVTKENKYGECTAYKNKSSSLLTVILTFVVVSAAMSLSLRQCHAFPLASSISIVFCVPLKLLHYPSLSYCDTSCLLDLNPNMQCVLRCLPRVYKFNWTLYL